MSDKKLIVVVGVTGNQGGSVARRFLKDPRFNVRGITRDPLSAASKALAEQGVEIVKADLHDVESLKSAFKGANVIFSVTQYCTSPRLCVWFNRFTPPAFLEQSPFYSRILHKFL